MLFHQGQAVLVIGRLPDIAPCLVQRSSERSAIETHWATTIAKVSSRAFRCPLKELLSALCARCNNNTHLAAAYRVNTDSLQS